MIVISSYNDINVIKTLLNSLNDCDKIDEKVIIVCTCPKQTEMINFLNSLKPSDFKFYFEITITPYSGYDTGGYIWVYNNFIDDYYIFLQDSLIINNKNWLDVFKSHRDVDTINAWCSFILNDESSHTDFFFPKMGFTPNSLNGEIGIFGPMFQISRNGLDKINNKFNINKFIPYNKMSACAMERGWTYLIINSGLNINTIDGSYSRNMGEYQTKLFTKIFNHRT